MRQGDTGSEQEQTRDQTHEQTREQQAFIASFVEYAAVAKAPLLASSLRSYAEAEDMSWEDLASSLGCTTNQLNAIAVCRPPRANRFMEDVEEIAAGILPADRLLLLLREVMALEELAAGGQATENLERTAGATEAPGPQLHGGLLLAARDRDNRERETGLSRDPASGDPPAGGPPAASEDAVTGGKGLQPSEDEEHGERGARGA